jgi:hypothetical protein
MKHSGIIGGIVVAVVGAIVLIGVLTTVNNINKEFAGPSSSERVETYLSNVVSGEQDETLRQGCIEKLNSYGFDTVTEGQINLCVDTAKAFAYNELNK